MRAIAAEERERTYLREFESHFGVTRLVPPPLRGPFFPQPPRGVRANSAGWKAVRAATNRAAAVWYDRATAIEICGDTVVVFRCACCGTPRAAPDPCGRRVCPSCAKAVRRRNIREVEHIVRSFRNPPRFLTLTIASRPSLAGMLLELQDAMTRLRARRWWRTRVRGGVLAIEITYKPAGGWHVHIHALIDGTYLPRPELVSEWQAATGCKCPRPRRRRPGSLPVLCSHSRHEDRSEEFARASPAAGARCPGSPAEPAGQNIKLARPGAVRELCKYIGKDLGAMSGMMLDLEALKEFLRATDGRRMLVTFGTAYDIERAPQPTMDTPCPTCGAVDWILERRESLASWQLRARPPPVRAA